MKEKLQKLQNIYYSTGASFTLGLLASTVLTNTADAQILLRSGNNFSSISENVTDSLSFFPSLLSGLSYLAGAFFGIVGILKVKDHMDAPEGTPLKEGAVRLAAGGALFALPLIYEASLYTIGTTNAQVTAPDINAAGFNAGDEVRRRP